MNGVDQNAGRGDITVFAINASSGKLTLITNQNTFNTNGTQLPYFTVNYNPVQMVTASATSMFWTRPTTRSDDASDRLCHRPDSYACATPDVFLYAINTSTGQLTLTQNAPLALGIPAGAASTIALAAGGKYVYIADNGTQTWSGDRLGPDSPFHREPAACCKAWLAARPIIPQRGAIQTQSWPTPMRSFYT